MQFGVQWLFERWFKPQRLEPRHFRHARCARLRQYLARGRELAIRCRRRALAEIFYSIMKALPYDFDTGEQVKHDQYSRIEEKCNLQAALAV